VIVQMPTKAQASKVAKLTGGTVLSDKNAKATTKVKLEDFESHRSVIEGISVLFKLFSDDGIEVPSGWMLRGAVFEMEWPKEQERRSLIWSHFGARRFAKNWALGRIKEDLDKKKVDPNHVGTPWTLADLRRLWNQEKDQVAPWWKVNSKECYSSGIADLVDALGNWSSSKKGRRKGKRVGFPRFESKRNSHNRIRFSTGTMRLEPDRRHITIPVIGTLRSKENTRALQRHVAKGNAHILSMTLSERWGRLFVSIQYAVRIQVAFPTGTKPSKPDAKAGVDLGLRSLATIEDSENEMVAIANPAPLRATLDERRRVSRQLSRRIPGSRGHRAAKAKLARFDRRAVCLRYEIYHQFTRNLVDTYGEVHIEDLNLAGMKQSMGRRAFRRSVSDAALGMFRPMLSYKAEVVGTKVVVVDRFYPSSQIHHGCGGLLQGDTKLAKVLTCQTCHVEVDRDVNAAKNIRDWPEHANPGSVGASALSDPGPPSGGTDDRSDGRLTDHRARLRKTSTSSRPRPVRREPKPAPGRQRNPARGASE
jgi:putative transposase